ncbi:uncharacterized protein [Physcomitrium patens]|uniref:uncharacterized protein n=1 Tax=Physcomitrium patens TaxID=3218 RepID=UPI003CCCDF1C
MALSVVPKACGDRVHPGSAESGVGFRVLRRTLCRGESWICGENWMWPTTLLKPRLCRLYRNPFGASWSDLVASGVPFSLLGFVPKLSLVYYIEHARTPFRECTWMPSWRNSTSKHSMMWLVVLIGLRQ